MTTLLDTSADRAVHFVGIGGAGMQGLAELFALRGVKVTGCDAAPGDTASLERLGISVYKGHDPQHVKDARAVVITSAMSREHPELLAAQQLGLSIVRRAEALGEAVNDGTVVAVAGTHGKTTTTVMTTEALTTAGLAPTGIAGGRVEAWGGNLKFASERVFVVEADEYDRSFLALKPSVAVITNVEADHLDIYRDVEEIRATFAEFARPSHTIVLCADDSGADSLPLAMGPQIMRYGITSESARVRGTPIESTDGSNVFKVEYDGDELGAVALRVPGLHNVRNALAAISAGLALGAEFDGMRTGLEAFTGVDRRFQRLGEVRNIVVIDDYAHHPTEVSATLTAARQAYPGRRIVAAFQPHLFSRTRDFAREFAQALESADAVALAEIYPAREQPIPGVTSALISKFMKDAGAAPFWEGHQSDVANALAGFVVSGDVVITMGAGDITRSGSQLLARLTGDE